MQGSIRPLLLVPFIFSLVVSFPAQEDDIADIASLDLVAGGDKDKRYFLIGPAAETKAPATGLGLLVVLPGGSGGAHFHAFVKRSSSGPAAYAISLTEKRVKGSFVAMSVFKPDLLPPLDRAKGHPYFLYHSPDDRVCPFRMAEEAASALKKSGARVELRTYDGGHGWQGGP